MRAERDAVEQQLHTAEAAADSAQTALQQLVKQQATQIAAAGQASTRSPPPHVLHRMSLLHCKFKSASLLSWCGAVLCNMYCSIGLDKLRVFQTQSRQQLMWWYAAGQAEAIA